MNQGTPDELTRLNSALKGRYSVERELGEGGMATVYLADDLKHQRKVALKVLKPELAAVVGAERFLTEIKTTANLQHPHILPLFDSGEADGLLFYVMPFVQGESLRERLDREHQLPVEEAVRMATAVANALDHAHRQGVIHRDIKPANILLQDGEPVVADFGIALAAATGDEDRLTKSGVSMGTAKYMSPEQATGDGQIGPASDIYSLGCVLYEMLSGDPPFTGSHQAVMAKMLTQRPTAIRDIRNTVPVHVEAALTKALARVPADRFGSAEGFAQELLGAMGRRGAQEPSGWSPRAVGAGVAAGIATMVLLGVSMANVMDWRGGEGWSDSNDLFSQASLSFHDGNTEEADATLCRLARQSQVDDPRAWTEQNTDARASVLVQLDRLRKDGVLLSGFGLDSVAADTAWFWVSAYSENFLQLTSQMRDFEADPRISDVNLVRTAQTSLFVDSDDGEGPGFFFQLEAKLTSIGGPEPQFNLASNMPTTSCHSTRVLSHLVVWSLGDSVPAPKADATRAIAALASSLRRFRFEWDLGLPIPGEFSPLGVPSYWTYSRDPQSGMPVHVWLVAEPSGWVSVAVLSARTRTSSVWSISGLGRG